MSFRSSILVLGVIVAWIPAVLLGSLWLKWFFFFTSIEDYGLNDFATVFWVAVGLALLLGTIIFGLLGTTMTWLILRESRRQQ